MHTLHSYFTQIYIRMAIGVALSGLFAWFTVNSPLVAVLQNPVYFYGLLAIEIGLVMGVQWAIHRISSSTASMLYVAYAALNGITLSGFLYHFLTNNFNLTVVIFGVAASMFVALAGYGYVTKKDLSGWGTFLFAGVWGVFFASIANIFFQNSLFDMVLSAVALLIFAALTVYDSQYYKNLYHTLKDEESTSKAITLGALHMYINFVMIFQNLLSLTSSRD
jgi:uncharacterized protein